MTTKESSKNCFYHFNSGLKYKEKDKSFYSEGFVATSHRDKSGDIIPKSTLSKIVNQINSNQPGEQTLFYPSYASIRHDWIDLENKQYKDLPIAGKAESAELKQLPDGEWGVHVTTHHNKHHPEYEKTKDSVINGYYPGYSIEYNTLSEHTEGENNILDDIEMIGYGFADGRFIDNPEAKIDNCGFKEFRPTEETKMTKDENKKGEVNFKEKFEALTKETEEKKVAEDKAKEEERATATKEADFLKMKTELKELKDAKMKEDLDINTKETEKKQDERFRSIVADINAKQMPGFTKFEDGAMGFPEVKEFFDVLNEGTTNFNTKVKERKFGEELRTVAMDNSVRLKEVANRIVNRFEREIYNTRPSTSPQIFNTKLKSVVEGVSPKIGTYDIGMAKIGVKALTAFNSPSNDETTYFQAPTELGDVYSPMQILQLNDDTIFLGIVPKEDHSNRQNIQFRAKTAYGTAGGYLEGDDTWTSTNSTRVKCEQNFAYWREIFEVTNQMKQAARAAGGIGDVLGDEISDANINMMKDINSKILTGAAGTYNGANSSGYNMLGLQHIMLASGNLYGKDRSSLNWLQAQTPDTTSEGISLNVMRKMIENVRTAPADAKKENLVFVSSLRQERIMYGLLQGVQGGFVPYSTRIGFKGNIDIDGIPMFADGMADTDDLFLCDFSHMRLAIQKAPSVTMMGITGAQDKGFVDFWFNLYTTKPKNNAWHSALST